jgi:hypothetical protein
MSDVMTLTATGCLAIAGMTILVFGGLKGWQGWLDLKRFEITGRHPGSMTDRIEIADLKERIRKLESIASCVDL